jgi:hypothetical protein
MKVVPVTHTVSAAYFAEDIKHIVDILEANGYDTFGMDFTDIIARRIGDAFARQVESTGARIKNHSWELKADRSLRIKLYLPHAEDLPLVEALLNANAYD